MKKNWVDVYVNQPKPSIGDGLNQAALITYYNFDVKHKNLSE